MEIDIFVLIACPENTLVDSSEFYKPIATPFEAYLACNKVGEDWTGQFVTDFNEIVNRVDESNKEVKIEDECPDFSLVTGKFRHLNCEEGDVDAEKKL